LEEAPPLFQGIMVDAKGKTVGRLILDYSSAFFQQYVIRQIGGIWVSLPVLETGFLITGVRLICE
jgi:hypothetical protein